MIRIGIAGLGFMGMIHHLTYQRVRGARVAAICSRNPKRLAGDWRSIQGNFGPRGSKMNLDGIARYERLEEMLADDSLDMIDVCVPTAAHADAAVCSLRAGKHVFCEKPIALEPKAAAKMTRQAAKSKRRLMIGHVLPYFPEYEYVLRASRSGEFGPLLGGSFKRITAEPTWMPGFFDLAAIGGPLLDLHVHDAHFIRLLFGMPRGVFASGRMRGETVEFANATYLFDDTDISVAATCGTIAQQGRAFSHGFEIYFQCATMTMDFSVLGGKPVQSIPLVVVTDDGKVRHPKLGSGDPLDSFAAELKEATRAIESDEPAPNLDAELAADAVRMCQGQAKAVATGKIVKL
jgi:predicted dehydrogenase